MFKDFFLLVSLDLFQTKNKLLIGLRKSPILVVFLMLLAGGFFYGYVQLVATLMEFVYNQEIFGVILATKLIQIMLFIAIGVALLSSFNTAIAQFYLSKDLEFQFGLPVRFESWMVHRYWQVFLQSSWMLIFFGSPFIWTFLSLSQVPLTASLLGLLTFFILCSFPVTTAVILCMMLVRVFPAKRLHQIILVVTVVIASIMVLLFRYMEPEQFIGPGGIDRFRGFVDLVNLDKQRWNPASWAGIAVTALSQNEWGQFWAYFARLAGLFLTSLGLFVFAAFKLYRAALDRALQALSGEGDTDQGIKRESFLSRQLSHPKRSQVAREVLLFLRDPSQWSQVFVMIALLGLYLFSLSKIPLEPFGESRVILGLGNTSFVAFIALSLASRFVFTSFSADGQAIWLMRTSPDGWLKFIRGKFMVFGVPILLFSQVLIWGSGKLIDLTFTEIWLLAWYGVWDSLLIVLISLSLGMLFINPGVENPLKMVVSPGGFVLMAAGAFMIGLHVSIRLTMRSARLNALLERIGFPDLQEGRGIIFAVALLLIEASILLFLLLKGMRFLKRGHY